MATSISVAGWYAMAGGLTIALLTLFRLFRFCYARIRNWLNRHLFYPILIADITRLQITLLLIYIAANVIVLIFFLKDTVELKGRAALLSVLNMIPLFLGGRTSLVADLANIPLHVYYFWHFWISLVVIGQGLLHAGLSISQRASRTSPLAVSGWIVSSLFVVLLCLSVPFIRKRSYAIYNKLHFIIVLSILVSLVWHVLMQHLLNRAPVFIAAGLWMFSKFYRLLQYVRWGRNACVEKSLPTHHATYLKIRLRKPIRPFPGMYFYLYFSGLPIRYKFQGFPMVVFFWRVSPGEDVTKEISFLIQHRNTLSRVIADTSLKQISFEGPYGNNLRLETYETIVLIAEGIGIAAVLPYALHLAQRRHHDERFKRTAKALYRDVTRKVDILWKLEDNDEENWCNEQLSELMHLDAKKRLISGRLFYPLNGPRKLHIPRESAKFWKCYSAYSDKAVDEHIDHYIKWNSYSPGRSIVLVCGSSRFSQRIREFVVTAPRLEIDFAETEFLLQSSHQPNTPTKITKKARETIAGMRDIPLNLLQASGNRNRKITTRDIRIVHKSINQI